MTYLGRGTPLFPVLPFGVTFVARGLEFGFAFGSRSGRFGRVLRRLRLRRRLALGLLGRRFLGPGRLPLLLRGEALGGGLLVDLRARAVSLERLLLGLGGLAGAVLETVVVGHGCDGLSCGMWRLGGRVGGGGGGGGP